MALYLDLLNEIVKESDLSKMGLTNIRAVSRENHFALVISRRQYLDAAKSYNIFLVDEINKVLTKCNSTGMRVSLEAIE